MAENDAGESAALIGPRHGEVCYLQLPALDLMTSAAFYEQIFGWKIERPYPSFEAPGLIGQWVDDRAPAPDSGPLIWITSRPRGGRNGAARAGRLPPLPRSMPGVGIPLSAVAVEERQRAAVELLDVLVERGM